MEHPASLRMAAAATLHCIIGCAIGELIGVTIGTQLGLQPLVTIIVAAGLSFISGYTVSTIPIVRSSVAFWPSLRLVFAADTLSIVTMTIVDNLCMVLIPGAFDKDLTNPTYWLSRFIAMTAAFIVAWPVNYYLLKKGKGHALTHHYMHR